MKKASTYGCAIPALVLLLVGASSGVRAQKKETEPKRTLFGVQLSPGATQLLNQVEAVYGFPIRPVESSANLSPGSHGRMTVKIDGVPEIQINPANGRDETTIVHELMHLLDIADGVRFPVLRPESKDNELGRKFVLLVCDQVEHAYFFPRAHKLGIDLTVEGKADLQHAIQQNLIQTESAEWREAGLREASVALFYFECVAVLQDEGLAAELEKNAFLPEDKEARRLGRLAVGLTQSLKFETPEDETTVFIEICNTLLDGKYRITPIAFYEQQRGKIIQKYAGLQIERLDTKPMANLQWNLPHVCLSERARLSTSEVKAPRSSPTRPEGGPGVFTARTATPCRKLVHAVTCPAGRLLKPNSAS
jgi:hypothetical protein